MIKFAEEMTKDQLREAVQVFLRITQPARFSDGYLSDESYGAFKEKFPKNSVISYNSIEDNGDQLFKGVIETNSGIRIWEAPIGDSSGNLAYIRAQLHWLMPEGFDFPD